MGGSRRQRDWQKCDPHLRRHPAFIRFRDSLNIGDNEAHGILAGLWAFAFDFAQDGDLSRFSKEDVALSIGYQGSPEQLFMSLGRHFLDGDRIRAWEEWGGALFTDRIGEAQRKWDQRNRSKRSEQEEVSTDVPGTSGDKMGQCGTVPPEKRRVEESREHLNPPSIPPTPSDQDDDEVLEGDIVTRVDGDALFDLVFWPSWPTGGSRKRARLRFLSHSPEEMEAIITAAGHYTAHVQALRFTVRAEYFVGGEKSYWEEWADGPPPLASNWFGGNGGGGAKQVMRDADTVRVVSEVYGTKEWE